MTTSLDISPEKRRLLAMIREKEKQYNQILEKIRAIQNELDAFEKLYNVKIKGLYARLNELERILLKYHHISEHVDEIFSFEEAEKIFDDTMRDRRARMEEEFHTKKRKNIFIDKKDTLPKKEREELKRLYYKLASIFHPDKQDGDEHMMKYINKLYKDGNLKALKDLELEHIEIIKIETIEDLEHKILSLTHLIQKANNEIRSIRKSDIYVIRRNLMKKNKETDGRILDSLAEKISRQIQKQEEQLEHFLDKYGPVEEMRET